MDVVALSTVTNQAVNPYSATTVTKADTNASKDTSIKIAEKAQNVAVDPNLGQHLKQQN